MTDNREALCALHFPSDPGNWQAAFECDPSLELDIANVDRVIASADGHNDGDSWLAVLRLKDGRFAFLSAWCDYTGWGCRDGATMSTCDTLEDLMLGYVGDEDALRLGLKMPDASDEDKVALARREAGHRDARGPRA